MQDVYRKIYESKTNSSGDPAMHGNKITPTQAALNFLEGLKQDVKGSRGGIIEIEDTDIEQIDNCIQLLEGKTVK